MKKSQLSKIAAKMADTQHCYGELQEHTLSSLSIEHNPNAVLSVAIVQKVSALTASPSYVEAC